MSFTALYVAMVCVGHRREPNVAKWLTPSEKLLDACVDADLRSLYALVPGETLHEHLAFWDQPEVLEKFYDALPLLEKGKKDRILTYGLIMSDVVAVKSTLRYFGFTQ